MAKPINSKPLKILSGLLVTALLATTLMWLTSYTHYTSIGIDVDTQKNKQITHHYYRVRWPGNGSIWLGGGISQRASDPNKPYEPFDLAATFLAANPEKPQPKSWLNRMGFWYPKINQQWWIGVPAFMPIALIGLILFRINIFQKYSIQ